MAYVKLLAAYFIFFIKIASVFTNGGCGHPDIPESGFYSPVEEKYIAGDSVKYACRPGFLLKGKARSQCNSNGEWQNQIPFCDSPVKLKNPTSRTVPHSHSYYINQTTDGDTRSCFKTASATGTTVEVFLEPSIVHTVRIFFLKGSVNVKVVLRKDGTEIKQAMYKSDLDDKQWVDLEFENTTEITKSICITDIRDKRNEFEICEIEAYIISDPWCANPPEHSIVNGYLVVGREKATLNCEKGYIPGDKVRLVCDSRGSWSKAALECKDILCDPLDQSNIKGGNWITSGKGSKLSIGVTKTLKCHPGYTLTGSPPKITCGQNGTWTPSTAKCKENRSNRNIILGASITAGIVILSGFILVICLIFKKSSKPVVVVLNAGEDGSHNKYCFPSSPNEAEYSTINYDQIPSSPPKTSPKPPDLLMEYSSPINQLRRDQTEKKRTELKSSSLYGK